MKPCAALFNHPFGPVLIEGEAFRAKLVSGKHRENYQKFIPNDYTKLQAFGLFPLCLNLF